MGDSAPPNCPATAGSATIATTPALDNGMDAQALLAQYKAEIEELRAANTELKAALQANKDQLDDTEDYLAKMVHQNEMQRTELKVMAGKHNGTRDTLRNANHGARHTDSARRAKITGLELDIVGLKMILERIRVLVPRHARPKMEQEELWIAEHIHYTAFVDYQERMRKGKMTKEERRLKNIRGRRTEMRYRTIDGMVDGSEGLVDL
jgi:hypothetical protein